MEKLLLETPNGLTSQVWFANQGSRLAVFHHGVPKPRQLTPEELATFARFGYSVAAIVRPGYLDSQAAAQVPSMAEIAPITASVAEQLGFGSFVSIGFSGGGPRALADAALNAATSAAITIGSVAAPNLDFDYAGSFGPEEAESIEALRLAGRSMLPQFEKWAAGTPEFDHGAAGWLDDELSLISDWGFDLSLVQRPVVIIASPDDQNVPITHGRWLNSKLPTSRLIEVPGANHDALVSPENLEIALKLLED